MSDNVMVQPLFHQRSHSMPATNGFINHNDQTLNGGGGGGMDKTYDFKRPSPLKPESSGQLTNEGFPLPIPKSLTPQFHPTMKKEGEESKFFCQPKTTLNVFDYNRKTGSCPIVLNCKMDRGFFVSQGHWTCYRRNYFQVTASLVIPGHTDQTCYALQLNSDKPMQPIHQFFLRLKACTSNNSREDTMLETHNMIRPVALTQMTPKRDKGPQREPPSIPVTPSDHVFGSDQVCVTFERLQFRVATANNGKRRASQQYFRLIFELVAQLDDATQHVVSECYSLPLVVRGRSPGHYSSDPERDMKKRKLTPEAKKSPTTNTTSDSTTLANSSSVSPHHALPTPQYVYTPPPMIVDTKSDSNTTATTADINSPPIMSYPPHHPIIQTVNHSSFGNFHGRSQSANDSEFFARHRAGLKYQPIMENQQEEDMFDNYNVGISRALRNWQQQVSRQRTDSSATFESYMSSNDQQSSSHRSTRPGTPIPYNSQLFHSQQQSSPTHHWEPARQQYMDHEDKINHQQQSYHHRQD